MEVFRRWNYSRIRKGWFSNTSFTTGLKTLPAFRTDAGRNVGKVFNPVVKLVLENQPFLMPELAEKPSLHYSRMIGGSFIRQTTFPS